MPKVSICIPTYNNLIAFQRCFESVLIQTYKDYEVIITDDSTNDDIKNYLSTLQLTDNIHYYKNQLSLGSPENWNESIRKASGEYIKILHHDDFFTYENSLQIFVDLLNQNPETDFAFVASKNFNHSKNEIISYNRPTKEQINKIENNPKILLNGNFIGAPSATIYRNKYDLFFDKKLIWFVDLDFYVSILSQNKNLKYSSIDAITVGGDDSRISENVKDDEKINIYEFFHLLEKWKIEKINSSIFAENFYSLVKKYNIENLKDIRKNGFFGDIPNDLQMIFLKAFLLKKKNRLAFYAKKIYHKIYPTKSHIKTEKCDDVNTTESSNVIIGKNSIIEDSKIGTNIKIGAESYLYNVDYGDYSYNSIRVTMMNCTIGKFCSIAQGVSIGLGKHPVNEFVSTHPAFYSTHKQCGVTFVDEQLFDEMGNTIIGNDVWIGANCIIADDVTLGNGAIIAANSFVNQDVPDYAIFAGTPAKLIRYRFTEKEISFLLEYKWWDKDVAWLQKNKDLMLDIKSLMKENK